MQSINPATEEKIAYYPEQTYDQLQRRIDAAKAVFPAWREQPWAARAERMKAIAKLLREQQRELAELMTREMGKPITEAEAEIGKCAWVCEYYAEHAETFLTNEPIETEAASSYVRFDPLGTILAVMPWNFPFWQVFRFLAPALMAGNTALLKHASNVTGCALAIERVVEEAGFPHGVFACLLIGSGRVPGVIDDPAIAAVTLTGSEPAGRSVAERAGERLKKTVLELGGSDPFIVLADVDIESVSAQAARARTINSGQSCIAAKRFIVEQPVLEQFTEAFIAELQALRVGNPLDHDTQIGPLARKDLRSELQDQVDRSVWAGASVRLGGKPLEGTGFYYPPSVLCDVKPDMPAFEEELFGPVAAVIAAGSSEEAITLANQSRFGLGASIWTADPQRGEQLAGQIESGCVFVNHIVKSDPRVPFGGVKESGYGRELSHYGIHEFVNIKTVWVA